MMQLEVEQIDQICTEHYNRINHEVSWSNIPLRSVNGGLGNNVVIHATALPAGQEYKDSMLMLLYPHLKQAVDFFKMEKMAVRLMKLNAGAVIKAHKDHELRFEEGQVRIHIPVSTNAQLAFYLDEEAL